VQYRAVSALEHIRLQHPNQVFAVFSHGDVIRTSVAHYMGTPLDLFQRIVVSIASISVLVFHNEQPSVFAVNYVSQMPTLEIKSNSTGE
jgi:probable phosphoglycerate mutase